MTTTQLTLKRVNVRGPEIKAAEGMLGNVLYRREPTSQRGIYMVLRLPHWRSGLRYPQRNDERMKITVLKLPIGRHVSIEFCGTDIDALCDAVAATNGSDSQTVLALRPLLRYLQENVTVA